MSRDLKADLELCNEVRALDGFETDDFKEFVEVERIASEYAANVREGWPHAIERAIEAEELSRELLKALKFFFKCLSDKDLVEPEPSQFMSLELSQIAAVCQKAKEVLGDG